MEHKTYESKKAERVYTYYERTVIDYKITCDCCGREIEDKELYFTVEEDSGEDYDWKDYCKDCAPKKTQEWLDKPTESLTITPSIVDKSLKIGKTSDVDVGIYNLFKDKEL